MLGENKGVSAEQVLIPLCYMICNGSNIVMMITIMLMRMILTMTMVKRIMKSLSCYFLVNLS